METASIVTLIAALAWTPFPLGSNRPWSWSMLAIFVALSGAFLIGARWTNAGRVATALRHIAPILAAGALALIWAVVQMMPAVPASWAHPVWASASEILGTRLHGRITLSPWRSETEYLKLLTYAVASVISYIHAQRADRAHQLLLAIVAVGGAYAVYGLILGSLGVSQIAIFYHTKINQADLAGPFVNRNSFATYAGLMTLCGGARFFSQGWPNSMGGSRAIIVHLIRYGLGAGLFGLVVTLAAATCLIATGSRAGTTASITAIISMIVLAAQSPARTRNVYWFSAMAGFVAIILVLLFALNSHVWSSRVDDMAVSGIRLDARWLLWGGAWRMIKDAPLLGLGLGTYEVAYPFYSEQMLPFIMDRAHNDWLELAAGWGLVAACLWWGAIAGSTYLCLRGYRERRRDRVFSLLAIGATILVGVHAVFDFSLQIPAIALLYAVILGLGLGQAFSSRDRLSEATLRGLKLWSLRCGLVLPIAVIVAIVPSHFLSGLADYTAEPMLENIKRDIDLPTGTYGETAQILSHVSRKDGDSLAFRAEALRKAGARDALTAARNSAATAPADARAWIEVAESDSDLTRRAKAEEFALELAPREYYLLGPLLEAGAPLWNSLSNDARKRLVADATFVVHDPTLHDVLSHVLAAPAGPILITQAFAGDPEGLRAFNRRLARERLGL